MKKRSFYAAFVASSMLAASAQANDGDVTIAITEGITGYNPYANSAVLVGMTWCQVYGCLTRWDFDEGRFVPFLAEEVRPDGEKSWLVRLRDDWPRHNGDAVTAEDVVHSIERTRSDPDSVSQASVHYIESVEIVDDRTVRILTTEPIATLPNYLATIQITSKAVHERYGARDADRLHPYGAGPYRLVDLQADSHMVLERVDDHPLVGPDNPRRMIFRVMIEPEQRVTALANGEIQIAQSIPPQLRERVDGLPNASAKTVVSAEMMFLAMQPTAAPFDDARLRKAICHAINRDAIIAALLGGNATKLNGPVVEGQFGFRENPQEMQGFDPDLARSLLEEAGYDGAPLQLQTPVGRYTSDRQISEAVVSMLQDVGLNISLHTPEWPVLWSGVQAGNVEFYYMGRGNMLDPSPALAQYFETGGSPRLKYSNTQVDELLKRERTEFDLDTRRGLLADAMDAIVADDAACFLWNHNLIWGVADNIDYTPTKGDRVNGWEIGMRP
ncbi:ABC transporter substrate-binding protein [Aquamicrobium sp. LC103]|uniref:ABC transporter substrate-binding protein n=1 Tax=Aquamicrobium sp. LC103 TaxID=1120658 RepID=UPI00063ECE08|nr:ABC transporter substrate-binding protein [Aquamicrobium sp. LC103]TKT74436.1 peptide ABC transporter substrate-binding protein [Aquamicrobium sp. LC103]